MTAALAHYHAVHRNKQKGSSTTLSPPLVVAATELLESFAKVDTEINDEESRIEDALESEDKKKLAAVSVPGALPTMAAYKPTELKVDKCS